MDPYREDLERCTDNSSCLAQDQRCPSRIGIREGLVVGSKREATDIIESTTTETDATWAGRRVSLLNGGQSRSDTSESKSEQCKGRVHDLK